MPIFEYICQDCRKRFELILYGSNKPMCPLCHGTNLDQQISVFAVVSGKTQKACAAAAGCGGSCDAGSGTPDRCPFD